MKRRLGFFAILLLATVTSHGQDLPRTTRDGVKGLAALADACVTAGGFKPVKSPTTQKHFLTIADPAKLREAVAARKDLLTPEVRDALIGIWPRLRFEESEGHLALMREAARAAGDDRLLAFAALFAAAQGGGEQQFDVSERAFGEAIRLFARLKDADWEARTRHQQAILYERVGLLDKAAEGFRRSLELFRTRHGDAHPMVPASLQALGAVSSAQGRTDEATTLLKEAIALLDRRGAPPTAGLANALTSLAHVYATTNAPARGLDPLRRALAIREQILDPDDPEIGKALDNLGDLQAELGEHGEALANYLRARALFEKGLDENHPDRAINLGCLARAYAALERYDEAIAGYRKALAALERVYGPDHPLVAASLSEMADVYSATGDPGRALEALTRALAIRRARFGGRHRTVAITLSKIGFASARLGRLEDALAHYQQALAMLRDLYGEDHPEVAANLNNIAAIRSRLGDSEGAVAAYRQVLAIYRRAFGAAHPNIATVLDNIGAEELRLGHFAEALAQGGRALEIYRASFGERHSQVALSHHNLAKVHASRGDRAKALQAMDQALASLQSDPEEPPRPFGKQDVDSLKPLPSTLTVLLGRGAELERDLGGDPSIESLRECARTYELAVAVLEKIRRRQVESEASKVSLGEDAAELFSRLVGALRRLDRREGGEDAPRRAFAAAEQGRARVFLEALGRSRARAFAGIGADLRASEADILNRLDQLDGTIAREQDRPLADRDPKRVGQLIDRRKAVEGEHAALIARMERESPRYAALKYPRPCSVEEARACLADDEVALLYVLGPESSSLVVVRKAGDPRTAGISLHALPPSGEIDELMSSLVQRKTLEDVERVKDLGARAYRMLLAPAADAVRDKSLVIVAGGLLGEIPFELLVEPVGGGKGEDEGGRFLVERHGIRYAPSLTTLHVTRLWERTRPRPDRTLWAMGDPVYNETDPRLPRPVAARPRGGSFDRLEGTDAEIAALGRLMGAAPENLHLGTEATESVIKAASASGALARFRDIHFATHGVLGTSEGVPPALVLTLTGDPRGEDGFLQLDEVTSLRLNADLVVLSACQTGQGRRYNAEGVSGLARAFLSAGSRGVLCSLWRVDDQATADLMLDVYSALKAGTTAANALQTAQRKRIDAEEPPLHWAPFILIGQ